MEKRIFAFLVVLVCAVISFADASMASQQLKTSEVCMMNNQFFGKEQIPVEVGGKTYYGCCEMCKTTLRENASTRISNDPYTGEEIDKADAFIVKKSSESDEVLYFKSAETYESFLTEHARI